MAQRLSGPACLPREALGEAISWRQGLAYAPRRRASPQGLQAARGPASCACRCGVLLENSCVACKTWQAKVSWKIHAVMRTRSLRHHAIQPFPRLFRLGQFAQYPLVRVIVEGHGNEGEIPGNTRGDQILLRIGDAALLLRDP